MTTRIAHPHGLSKTFLKTEKKLEAKQPGERFALNEADIGKLSRVANKEIWGSQNPRETAQRYTNAFEGFGKRGLADADGALSNATWSLQNSAELRLTGLAAERGRGVVATAPRGSPLAGIEVGSGDLGEVAYVMLKKNGVELPETSPEAQALKRALIRDPRFKDVTVGAPEF